MEPRTVTARLEKDTDSTWQASMLPWADGSAQISINKQVRDKEQLQLGQKVQLTIAPRERI